MIKKYNLKLNEVFITFFVPCFNEEKNIIKTIETIIYITEKINKSYEILIIDDCSTDNTVKIIEEYKIKHNNIDITLIKNIKNKGLGYNYIEGAYLGKGKYYMLVCGDNPQPAEYFIPLLNQIGNGDMIIPYPEKKMKGRGLSRRIISKIFIILVNSLSGHSIRYYNGEVIHLRYNVIRWHGDTTGYAYQAEIICRMLNEGATYKEIPVVMVESGNSSAFTIPRFFSVSHTLLQIFLRKIRTITYRII